MHLRRLVLLARWMSKIYLTVMLYLQLRTLVFVLVKMSRRLSWVDLRRWLPPTRGGSSGARSQSVSIPIDWRQDRIMARSVAAEMFSDGWQKSTLEISDDARKHMESQRDRALGELAWWNTGVQDAGDRSDQATSPLTDWKLVGLCLTFIWNNIFGQ